MPFQGHNGAQDAALLAVGLAMLALALGWAW